MRPRYLALVFALLVGTAAAPAREFVALSKVPPALRDAAATAAPGVKWLVAVKQFEGGKDWYRFLGKDAYGHTVRCTISADCNVYVEVYVRLDEVPAAVTAALRAQVPGFRVQEIQAMGRSTRAIVGNRFKGTLPGGGNRVLLVKADGSRVTTE